MSERLYYIADMHMGQQASLASMDFYGVIDILEL